jgi:hypothetical protein
LKHRAADSVVSGEWLDAKFILALGHKQRLR